MKLRILSILSFLALSCHSTTFTMQKKEESHSWRDYNFPGFTCFSLANDLKTLTYTQPPLPEIEMFKNNPTAQELSKTYSIDELEKASKFLAMIMSTAEWDEIFIKRGDVYDPYISKLHTLECAERRGAEASKRDALVKDAIEILNKKEESKSQKDDDELSKTATPKKESGFITTDAVDWARLESMAAKLDVSPSQAYALNLFAKDEFYGVYNVKLEYGYTPVRPPKKGGDYIDTTLYGMVKTMEEHQSISSSKKDSKKSADDAKKDVK